MTPRSYSLTSIRATWYTCTNTLTQFNNRILLKQIFKKNKPLLIEHGEMKLCLIWKLYPYWLVRGMESIVHTTRGEK